MVRETSKLASPSIDGEKPYQKRARQALPLLVRQAKAEQPITYGDLAEELGIYNPRTLNYPLGTIGNALLALSSDWGVEVPPIQALVKNKSTGLPGSGVGYAAPDAKEFREASTKRRREIVNLMLSKVYGFTRWDDVLRHFKLAPVTAPTAPRPARPIQDWAGGESPEHLALKRLVAANPWAVGLPRSCAPGETEFLFGSADAVDVLFRNGREWVGVEVKSARSGESDVARGLFQCVKYRALIEATQMAEQLPIKGRTLLALGGALPRGLVALRNTLGVEVIENVG